MRMICGIEKPASAVPARKKSKALPELV